MKNFNCNSQNDMCYTMLPISSDIWINKNDCKVRLDIKAKKTRITIICGYIYDCMNKPIKCALVKLLKYKNKCELETICCTYSDNNGFYQFEIPFICEGRYKIDVTNNEGYNDYCDECWTRENEFFETDCKCQRSLLCGNRNGKCKEEKQNSICYY